MGIVPAEIVGRRLTLADYEALPEDADYEIVDGVLYVAPRPFVPHQSALGRLYRLVADHAESRGLGEFILDVDLVVDAQNTYVSPDLMFFTPEQYARIDLADKIRVVPELIVEILSESTRRRDMVAKRDAFARLGVPHYWLLDGRGPAVLELTLDPASRRYRERRVEAPELFRPALFPGLVVDLERMFA